MDWIWRWERAEPHFQTALWPFFPAHHHASSSLIFHGTFSESYSISNKLPYVLYILHGYKHLYVFTSSLEKRLYPRAPLSSPVAAPVDGKLYQHICTIFPLFVLSNSFSFSFLDTSHIILPTIPMAIIYKPPVFSQLLKALQTDVPTPATQLLRPQR